MPADIDDSALAVRRRRLLFRSEHRGNKENDILLGQFARAELDTFDSAQLDLYEALLEEGDNDIFDWVARNAEVPVEKDSPVLRRLMAFKVVFR